MNNFDIIYRCKTSGKEFKARRIVHGEYSLLNPDTGLVERVTQNELKKRKLIADKSNKKATSSKRLRVRNHSREFQEYLKKSA